MIPARGPNSDMLKVKRPSLTASRIPLTITAVVVDRSVATLMSEFQCVAASSTTNNTLPIGA